MKCSPYNPVYIPMVCYQGRSGCQYEDFQLQGFTGSEGGGQVVEENEN